MVKEPPEKQFSSQILWCSLLLVIFGCSVYSTEIYEEAAILPTYAVNSSGAFKDLKCDTNSSRFVNTNFTLTYTLSNGSLEFNITTGDGYSIYQQEADSRFKVEKLFLLGTSFVNSAITSVKGKNLLTLTGGVNDSTKVEFTIKEKKVVVELQDVEGENTCTTIAYGNVTGFRLVLEPGLEPDRKDELGLAPLHWAAMFGGKAEIQKLIQGGADPDTQWTRENATPLHFAAIRGDGEVVRFLVENGADMNAKDVEGMSVVDAAVYSNQSQTVKQLLELGANLTADPGSGRTALHIAAERENKEIIETLLEHGLDVNTKDKEGRAPINIAIEYHQPGVVRQLIERGAHVNLTELVKLYGEKNVHYLLPGNITIVE